MANVVKFKRGTRAQLNAAAAAGNLVEGEPYYITDEDRIAIGASATTYTAFRKDDEYPNLNQLGGFSSVTQALFSTNQIVAGWGSGSVGLTINDGGGNANVTFNHRNLLPDQNGNAARILVNTDATSGAYMRFQLKSNVTANTSVALPTVLELTESGAYVQGVQVATVNDIPTPSGLTFDGTIETYRANSQTNGSTYPAWGVMSMDTTGTNSITGASLNAGNLRLPAGLYLITGQMGYFNGNPAIKTVIKNTTANTNIGWSMDHYAYSFDGVFPFAMGFANLSVQSDIQLQYYKDRYAGTYHYANALNYEETALTPTRYATLQAWKLS